jgi:thiol:disulfide interchange protein DsbD
VPFVFLSLLPGRLKAMPRSGEWMNTVKVTLGFVELAAALKFLSNADLVLGWGWLSRELFLALWMGIAGVAALYLLGTIPLKQPVAGISPGRMVTGLGFVLFALYCWIGAGGSAMDPVMTAIIPNYSSRLGTGGAAAGPRHALVVDDVELARTRARAEGKLLLLNFTGYT